MLHTVIIHGNIYFIRLKGTNSWYDNNDIEVILSDEIKNTCSTDYRPGIQYPWISPEVYPYGYAKIQPVLEGMKESINKARTDLVPAEMILGVADVLAFGATKYETNNWRNFTKEQLNSHIIGAALRHIYAYQKGEFYDPESGLPHLDHAITNLSFMTTLLPKPPIEKGPGNVGKPQE